VWNLVVPTRSIARPARKLFLRPFGSDGAGRQAQLRKPRLSGSQDHLERLLLETRDRAEKQVDDIEQANADLQPSNITLNHKLSELTTLHDMGAALRGRLTGPAPRFCWRNKPQKTVISEL
jgi:hypothetical protein